MIGTRWYKCDLHLHTPASKCFQDRDVTPEQWIAEAIERKLRCVAVTDHNSAEWIDKIQEAAKDKPIHVFPGVEITCSDAKVHLLVFFEIGTKKQSIEDFLTLCRIDRNSFGEQDAHSPLSVEEIINEVNKKNAVCIPAHIDEYAGIFAVAHGLREKLFESDGFLGVQVVHDALMPDEKEYNKNDALIKVNRFRGASDENISAGKLLVTEQQVKDWRSPVLQAKKYNKAILTFSDNPHSEFNSKHGLWGMGRRYTWVKMDQTPSLESLRQAMLLHQFRIKNDFVCPGKPYSMPETWIESIIIKDTEVSKKDLPAEIHFNPQMNTIIGGRGSGKSSILQFLRGVFGKENEIESLANIKTEFANFFKVVDKKKQGVLKPGCSIEIVINRRGEWYKIVFLQETPQKNKKTIHKYNEITDAFDEEMELPFLAILDFHIYSQKQIYEIANNLNSLREKIDESSDEILESIAAINALKGEYVAIKTEIRNKELRILKKDQLRAEITDIEQKIRIVKQTGIADELKRLQEISSDSKVLLNLKDDIALQSSNFDLLIQKIRSLNLKAEYFSENSLPKLNPSLNKINEDIENVAKKIEIAKNDFLAIITSIDNEVENSGLAKEKNDVEEAFQAKKVSLIESGILKLDDLESDIRKLESKQNDLAEIEEIEKAIEDILPIAVKCKERFIEGRVNLTQLRKEYLDKLLANSKVRAKVKSFKDLENLEDQLRDVFGTPEAFDKDISTLLDYWSGGDAKRANSGVFDLLKGIRNETNPGTDFDKRFSTKIKTLNGEQLDSLDLMFPEDLIQLEYKTDANAWKALSTASAGQKTAAILTLILAEGNKPLILDQPEDDLDNFLIYDLVVDQLRKSKESRQIITVTHNANIPVNGDSEVIIVMDSETKHLSPKLIGTIEDEDIKKAVCSIMEGGTAAFNMRSKRYQNVKTNG
ncbi:MAG: PHP domain-containing protein [Saprospiraceae bacterium]|nr:PHP domain-containing protein [Saprospiraceae bacterium]